MSNLSVLITGASQGIGKQIALKYAQQGATVSINYPFESEKENAQSVATEVEKLGGKGYIYEADVSDFSQVKKMTDDIISDIGKIDVLIANAGITKDKLIMRMSPEDWNSVINVNLTGSFNCTKAVTKHMMKARYGRIVYISSVVGIMGNAGQANYSASKGGIIALCKSVAKEFGARNITSNCIAPGYIETEMTRNLSEDVNKEFLSRVSLKCFGKAEDIANAALFLSSDQASYITGHVLVVDGGLSL